ncbi:flagellar basal body P-ring formation chaperone FlgA [Tropicimonas sp. S265A]|uniref:flagellar basal body P-ring formation chaperone FlgA n=1 Tax=Tropicimonas sp. S265A TaxID=3415134 RepID=UPI003C7AC2C1
MRLLLIALILAPISGQADSLLAARTIRSQTILTEDDITKSEQVFAGAISDPSQVIGMESREIIYAGRPITVGQLGRPALIQRNEIITLIFETPIMRIETEARSLGRAGLGETVRVMNLNSRTTVSGTVTASGHVLVGK